MSSEKAHPELEWISLRRDGVSAALIAERFVVSAWTVRRATRDAGPYPRPSQQRGRRTASDDAVAARTARWVQARKDGIRVSDLAAREGVPHQLISRETKAHGPFPDPHPPADVVAGWVLDRRTGISSTVIARAAGVSVTSVREAVKPFGPFSGAGSRIPPGFVGVSGAAQLIGIGHPSLLRWVESGFLPAADATTSAGRLLWRETTMREWMKTAPLNECPRCGARLKRPRAHISQANCADRRSLGPTPVTDPAVNVRLSVASDCSAKSSNNPS